MLVATAPYLRRFLGSPVRFLPPIVSDCISNRNYAFFVFLLIIADLLDYTYTYLPIIPLAFSKIIYLCRCVTQSQSERSIEAGNV